MAVTYTYKRSNGTTFEYQQSIKEDALTECPQTGLPVERVFGGDCPDIMFMGKGWDKNRRLKEKQLKKRQTDPLYTTDSKYKKRLDDQLEKDHDFADAYQKKKHQLKKEI